MHIIAQKKGRVEEAGSGVFLLIAAQEAGAQLRDYLNLPDHDSKKLLSRLALIIIPPG